MLSDSELKYEITYMKCYLALTTIKFRFGESTRKHFLGILSEVAEKNRRWYNLDDVKFLKRLRLNNEKCNPKLLDLINDMEGCYVNCGRAYFFLDNSNQIIEDYDGRYFLLLTICLNQFSDENVEKILEYQFSKYQNKEEFLKKLRLAVREQSGKIVPPHTAETVIEWVEERKGLGSMSIKSLQHKRPDCTKTRWFFIGLKFANGEMDKLLEKHNNNFTQVANELGNENGYRPYISATASKTKGDKNLYASVKKLEKIQAYCKENKIETTAFFKGRIKHFNLNQ